MGYWCLLHLEKIGGDDYVHNTDQYIRLRVIIGGVVMLHMFIKLLKKYLCNYTELCPVK